MANAAALTSAELTNQHLEEALTSWDMIGRAKGILMAHQNISADAAFDLLVRASQRDASSETSPLRLSITTDRRSGHDRLQCRHP